MWVLRAEGVNHLCWPLATLLFMQSGMGCKHTVLVHTQFFTHQNSPSSSLQDCFKPVFVPVCVDIRDCPDLESGPGVWPSWANISILSRFDLRVRVFYLKFWHFHFLIFSRREGSLTEIQEESDLSLTLYINCHCTGEWRLGLKWGKHIEKAGHKQWCAFYRAWFYS